MLFKSSALSPDGVAIDGTKTNVFTWQVNGSPSQTHYQLVIYNNSTNAVAYDSGKIASSIPQHTLPINGISNGWDWKWTVTVYSGTNSVVSDFVFIKGYTTPVVSMTVPSTIGTRSYTFNSAYTQSENVPYYRFKFILYDSSNTVLIDSGWLYGYNLSYTFEGFETGKSYSVQCIIEASYSLTGTTGKVPFSVSYTLPDSASYLVSTPDNDTGGVNLSWSPLIQVTGASTGTISYATGKFGQGVQINSGSKVTFNNQVPSDFTLNFWVKLPNGFTGDIVTLGNDEVKVGYKNSQFYLISDGKTATTRIRILPTDFFKLALKPDAVIIETSAYTEII